MVSWTPNQEKAINVRNKDVLVSAAAGSGKTAVLVERIIRKITDTKNPVDIDRMVIVTFTNAAASEMKYRIRNALDELIEREKNDNIIKQLSLIGNARICTIDSFCLDVIRNFFFDIDIDPSFRTAETGEMKLIENDVMEEMFEDYYNMEDEDFLMLIDCFGHREDDSKLEEIIQKIYRVARSHPWEDEWYDDCLDIYNITAENIDDNKCIRYIWKDCVKRLENYDLIYDGLEEMCRMPGGPVKYLPSILNDHNTIKMLINAETFERFIKLVNLYKFDAIGRITAKDCVDEVLKENVKKSREGFKTFFEKNIKGSLRADNVDEVVTDVLNNKRMILAVIKLTREYSLRIKKEKKKRNVIDFNDMEHMALDVLVKRENRHSTYTAAADSLADFYDEILIDEYQDSNMLQEEILRAVSKSRFSDKDNNTYMVGDVKQSIYRFRMACPDLFIEKYNSYGRDDASEQMVIELQNNFRSKKNVLESVNDVFERLMTKEFTGLEYDDSVRLNAMAGNDKDFGETMIYLMDKDSYPEYDLKVELEAEGLSLVIKELVENYKCSYKDIVILSRKTTDWAADVVNTLMDNGIPAYSDSSTEYFNVREVQVVLNFLNVLDNPLQDVAMTAVCLSFFGGFDTCELAKLRSTDKKRYLFNQLEEMQDEKAVKFVAKINEFRNISERINVYDLLWKVIFETGYYDYVKTMPSGLRRQANLDMLLVKAKEFQSTSYSGLFNFLRYIERLKKYEVDVSEASLLGENDDLVRIMSIHKSKGLEFPFVIIAGMGKKLNFLDASGDVVLDDELGVGMKHIDLVKRTKKNTLVKTAISSKIKKETISEEMRLLYVAMTRAKEKLIMTGMVDALESKLKKWQETARIIEKNGCMPYGSVAEISSFFDMVMPVYLCDGKKNGITGLSVITSPYSDLEENDTVLNSVNSNCPVSFREVDFVSLGESWLDDEETIDDESDISEKIFNNNPYPYEISPDKKTKVTVSELKQMQHDSDFEETAFNYGDLSEDEFDKKDNDTNVIELNYLKKSQDTLVGSDRGTAYHRIMECLDYTKPLDSLEDIKGQMREVLDLCKMDKKQIDSINVKDIYAFVTSKIGVRVAKASKSGEVYREQPFVYLPKGEDYQLVQGVIDLYIVEENDITGQKEITIVDYKTDRVKKSPEGEEELKRRYSVQLEYYADALKQLTGMPVKDKIIYSFELKMEIFV